MTFTPLSKPIAIKDQKWPIGTQPVVTTRTMTYNQVKYIEQCIEGILMQKTTFPVQILIHDDASDDSTIEKLKFYENKYPNILNIYYQKQNTYNSPKKKMLREPFFKLIKGKFVALCEGDDYWIDPFKLQKQVEYLEEYDDYGAVFSDYDQLIQVNGRLTKSYHNAFKIAIPKGYVFNDLLYNNPYVTCTSMYRFSFYDSFKYDFSQHNIPSRDYNFWLHIAANSKIGYLDKSMSVYRVLENSASHSKDIEKELSFLRSTFKIAEFFANYYNVKFDRVRIIKNLKIAEIKTLILKKRYYLLFNHIKSPEIIITELIKIKLIKPLIRLINN